MVVSFHPQVVDQRARSAFITRTPTHRRKEGECLANVPWRFLFRSGRVEDGMKVKILHRRLRGDRSILAHIWRVSKMLKCTPTTFRMNKPRDHRARAAHQAARGFHGEASCDFRPAGDPPCGISESVAQRARHTRAAIEQTAHISERGARSVPCRTASGMKRFSRSAFLRHSRHDFSRGPCDEPGHVGFDINGDT